MRLLNLFFGEKNRLELIAGVCDGILTALVLASGKLIGGQAGLSPLLAFHVAVASGVSGTFVFFVARYVVLRSSLLEAERQLNLTKRGQMATTRLGQKILREAGQHAFVNGVSSFCGAIFPLMVGVILPAAAVISALVVLSILGAFIGKMIHGRPIIWGVSLLLGGLAVALLGVYLNII